MERLLPVLSDTIRLRRLDSWIRGGFCNLCGFSGKLGGGAIGNYVTGVFPRLSQVPPSPPRTVHGALATALLWTLPSQMPTSAL